MLRASEPIKVGVVGLGYFGAHHARQYAANPAARLVAVADMDLSRASATADTYSAEAHADHRGLIGKVEAVSIAAPTPLHHAIARDFLEAGIHVFVEKPIAADVATAADLIARAKRNAVALQVGHIERFSPAFRRLQAEVREAHLIECVRKAPWKGRAADVDVVLDLMIHDIDLALTLAASPVVGVAAGGSRVVSLTDDAAHAILTFASGARAILSASRVAAKSERTVSVAGAGRQLIADLAAPSLTIISGEAGGVAAETIALDAQDNLAAEIAAFLDSVASGKPPIVDGRAGLDALKVADMILAAIAGRDPFASHNSVNGDIH